MKKNKFNKYIKENFGISDELMDLASKAEESLVERFREVDDTSEYHQARVLKTFQECGISDMHFGWNTGYGYDDMGRDAVERVYTKVFCGEKALVRPNIVNGTHAISLALLGLLRAEDRVIYATGKPYDTLQSVIGKSESDHSGTLRDMGIEYQEIPLIIGENNSAAIDLENLKASIDNSVKMVAIQRSKGYSLRDSITVNQIKEVADTVHKINSDIIVMVDNCYCEFVEEDEPLEVGADVICGSLIKNPGGGLALTGGYVVGKERLIDQISYRLTCPGIGSECGLTFGQNRAVLQGLFQAPRVVAGAVKGAMLCGLIFQKLGFEVAPDDYGDGSTLQINLQSRTVPGEERTVPNETGAARTDIIQAVRLGSPEAVRAFCEGIHAAAPIDSGVTPVPAPMPGYDDEIIMAAGTFVQGASIELSADGPLRDPYAVYFQGGLTYEHSKIGVLMAAQKLKDKGLLLR